MKKEHRQKLFYAKTIIKAYRHFVVHATDASTIMAKIHRPTYDACQYAIVVMKEFKEAEKDLLRINKKIRKNPSLETYYILNNSPILKQREDTTKLLEHCMSLLLENCRMLEEDMRNYWKERERRDLPLEFPQ